MKIRKRIYDEKKIEAFVEILLLIGTIFAFSYFVDEAFGGGEKINSDKNKLLKLYEKIVNFIFDEKNIVSAAELSNETLDRLKKDYPAFSEGELKDLTNTLIEEGKLSEQDLNNPEIVSNVFSETFVQAQNEAQQPIQGFTGFIQSILQAFLPSLNLADGGAIQQTLLDRTGGIKTCPESKEGKICQEYTGNVCNDKCSVACLDSARNELPDDSPCKLGICYDEEEGTCAPRSGKNSCEENGGIWLGEVKDANTIELKCTPGCCTTGTQAEFITQRQCEKRAENFGLEFGVGINFESDVNEPQCLFNIVAREEGACVSQYIDELGNIDPTQKDCKFITREECQNIGGEFNLGTLCSDEELETICEKQTITSCIGGKDEVYWLDSCGNRENIFEGDSAGEKDNAYNDGLVKNIDEINCNPLEDENCGKCNRLQGSLCAFDEGGEGAYCKDLSCTDSDTGKKYENGESWCAYQSSIGAPGPEIQLIDSINSLGFGQISQFVGQTGLNRATDTPGSSHFRKTCLDGEIQATACGSYRSELCEESRIENDEGEIISQAVCRVNRWQECLNYNPGMAESRAIGMAGPKMAAKILQARLMLTCGQDPDCLIKTVDLSGGNEDKNSFKFSYCTPRYPPGFDPQDPERNKQLCGQATQACTVVFVKQSILRGGGWKIEHNGNCGSGSTPDDLKPSREFVQQMNDFCTSMGDCGLEVNYVGSVGSSGGYSVSARGEDDKGGFAGFGSLLGGGFGNFLQQPIPHVEDANAIEGEFIQAGLLNKNNEEAQNPIDQWIEQTTGQNVDGLIEQYTGRFQGTNHNGPTRYRPTDYTSGQINMAMVSGALGGGALLTSWIAPGSFLFSETIGTTGFVGPTAAASLTPLGGFVGSSLGGAAGGALVGFLIKATGIGPGLGPGLTYGMIAAGGLSGSVIGLNVAAGYAQTGQLTAGFTGNFLGTGGAPLNALALQIAVVVIVAVILLIIIDAVTGAGEIQKPKVVFECKPWVAPQGVNAEACRKCGNDKLSDGSKTFPCNKYSCETLGQNCVFVPDSEGFDGGICEYSAKDDTSAPLIENVNDEILSEGFEYSEQTNTGFTIRKTDGECLDDLETVKFGFTLNEYARECRITGKQGATFDEMNPIGGGKEFQLSFSSLDLQSLGIEGLELEGRNDISLFVACIDLQGNENSVRPLTINLCVVPEDRTAPFITVPSPGMLPFGTEEHELVIYTNEPAECRWGFEDDFYSELENEFICHNELRERIGGLGFECSSTIPLEIDTTDVYIKCIDRPEWKGTEREEERNVNTQGEKVTLTRSDNALKIDYIKPDGETIITGTAGAAIILEAATSGGVDGTASCRFSINGKESILFEQTGANVHTQTLGGGSSRLEAGSYEVLVACEDSASNFAEKTASFTIEIDEDIPSITRIYAENGRLAIITNEKSECVFLNIPLEGKSNACDYDFEEGIPMSIDSGSDGLRHSTELEVGKKYHIKCKDTQDNQVVGQCSMIVEGGYF